MSAVCFFSFVVVVVVVVDIFGIVVGQKKVPTNKDRCFNITLFYL